MDKKQSPGGYTEKRDEEFIFYVTLYPQAVSLLLEERFDEKFFSRKADAKKIEPVVIFALALLFLFFLGYMFYVLSLALELNSAVVS